MGLRTGDQYVEGLRRRKHVEVYVLGKLVEDVTTHPFLKPSVKAFKATFDAAFDEDTRALARVKSPFIGEEINRFVHIHQGPEDLVAKVKLLRKLSHKVGTCFQRCVGWDALNTMYIVTGKLAEREGKKVYFERFVEYLKYVQKNDLALAGAMTDVKGVRSLRPHEQPNKDAYVHVVEERGDGIVVRGAKANITGVAVVDEVVVMPTRAMTEKDAEYAVAFAIPLDTPGVKVVVGRQVNDLRRFEGEIDGLPYLFNHEGLVIFEDVFVPWERVFFYKEWKHSGELVEIFASFHRQGYAGCKSGLGDVIIGASFNLARQLGIADKPHVQEKLTEMVFLNETMYSAGLAASWEGRKLLKDGGWWVNPMFANITKHLVARFPYEIARLSHDIAGGIIATGPSEADLKNPDLRKLIEKYIQGVPEFTAEDRLRMVRLLENISLSAAYLVESVHGAGSPQAQRISIQRLYDLQKAEMIARRLAGMTNAQLDQKVEPHKPSDAER
ncbi:4-hydroxyphenylacetate 3-hydroxylase family protein [Thermoproteus tenax]|uniref:4-hydroxybutyryl-CoA dehydratase n=1 Tax=Thermoproteus tenax (strain ATCC 35583 / DSM 2078 / JCM 9277 / NBRC 100435 / Kra 1) TaxID=768679 RepID=G4RJK0_THETK|nr:4-hydroxyphenylacetate 3-hydroxylase family protein [Thermoproteus tenax]CCC81745.1 4-hydroxybutyryl-CoA dehydratase [Thermoproteus tenax Kra 1]